MWHLLVAELTENGAFFLAGSDFALIMKERFLSVLYNSRRREMIITNAAVMSTIRYTVSNGGCTLHMPKVPKRKGEIYLILRTWKILELNNVKQK